MRLQRGMVLGAPAFPPPAPEEFEEGNIAGAWSYAKNNEHLMEKRLSLMDRCDECRADHRNCTCDQEEDKE